jgi:hypothetical protein
MTHRQDLAILQDGKPLGDFSVVPGFRDISEVKHIPASMRYAMELEQLVLHKQVLCREIDIMRILNFPHFPGVVYDSETPDYRYLMMEPSGRWGSFS